MTAFLNIAGIIIISCVGSYSVYTQTIKKKKTQPQKLIKKKFPIPNDQDLYNILYVVKKEKPKPKPVPQYSYKPVFLHYIPIPWDLKPFSDISCVAYVPGLSTRPTKSIDPVSISRIRNMKGRSMVTSTGSPGGIDAGIMTAVAAAASVPDSSTETNAL